jgi:hypothetical protein
VVPRRSDRRGEMRAYPDMTIRRNDEIIVKSAETNSRKIPVATAAGLAVFRSRSQPGSVFLSLPVARSATSRPVHASERVRPAGRGTRDERRRFTARFRHAIRLQCGGLTQSGFRGEARA